MGRVTLSSVLIIHVASTYSLLGLIWFMQLVHYPLIGQISRYRVGAYRQTRMRLATWVFAPLMTAELLTAIWLVWRPLNLYPRSLAWLGLGLLMIIWVVTAAFIAPKHEQLSMQYVEDTHRSLVRDNWVRTIGWSLRAILLTSLLLKPLF